MKRIKADADGEYGIKLHNGTSLGSSITLGERNKNKKNCCK